MNFCDAMKYAKDGYYVACTEWDDNEYIAESDGTFYLVSNGKSFPIEKLETSVKGIMRLTWYVFSGCMSFTEAMENVRKGYSIRHRDWPSDRFIFEIDGVLQSKSGRMVTPFCLCSVEDAKQIAEDKWIVMIE